MRPLKTTADPCFLIFYNCNVLSWSVDKCNTWCMPWTSTMANLAVQCLTWRSRGSRALWSYRCLFPCHIGFPMGDWTFFPFFADDGGQFRGTTAWQCWSSLGYRPRGNPGEKSSGAASIQLQQLRPCFSCFSLSSTIPRATSRLGLLVPETMIWSPGPHGREDWILLAYPTGTGKSWVCRVFV